MKVQEEKEILYDPEYGVDFGYNIEQSMRHTSDKVDFLKILKVLCIEDIITRVKGGSVPAKPVG